jgi:hypothetical protein
MSTDTTTPKIMVASFEFRDGQTFMRAETEERVQVEFVVHPMALAIMSLTMTSALTSERDKLRREQGDGPTPPAAPDSPEGLEG